MKTFKFSVFKKFAIGATFIVLVFGFTNLYLLWNSVYRSFEQEIDKRSEVLSRLIAERALQPIVYHDYVNVYKVLDEIKSNDPSIAYVFILDENKTILAQNYDIRIPFALIDANQPVNGQSNIQVISAKNFPHKIIRDIAYPILDGDIGVVRLGLIEQNIRKELNRATQTMLFMVLTFLLVGLISAFFFSFLITLPIQKISKKAQKINLVDIQAEDLNIKPLRFRTIYKYYFSDELDILVAKFNEMINRLKNNVKELQDTRDSFIQAEKLASIGTLTAGISHEINNPLAGIKNCVHRIEKEPENAEQILKYMALIRDAIEKIENVVKPLLDFSRKTDLVMLEADPREIVEKALTLTEYKIRKSNIEIERSFEDCPPVMVAKNLLEQVLINLIINGIDAIEDHKNTAPDLAGKLWFSIYGTEDGKTRIVVRDNGAGIDPAFHHKVFDPFFTSKKVGKGTGLGLYVSYNIIQELGGKIWFESIENQGTSFIIEL